MQLFMWCPGCDGAHAVEIESPPVRWEWDRNLDSPTISPSILVNGSEPRHPGRPRCHSYVRAGRWEFLGDSEHPLAGQTVAMVALPDWLVEE
ncbi:MAG TPA: DUF6527 family protein [Acidimicrobiales bacterium]|nr:DUF6527 family protein [Acidimicrobiales bacterium]